MRKFRNISANNNAVTRVVGQLALLTDVIVRHELRQPIGVSLAAFLITVAYSNVKPVND